MPNLVRLLLLSLLSYAVAFAAGTEPARAGIVSVGGSVTIQATPVTGTIAEGSIESANVSVWYESEGFLASNTNVQHDGTSGTFSKYSTLTGGTLYAGTFVESFLVQFDPTGSPNPAVIIGSGGTATITFDHRIVGVYAQSTGSGGNLNATDSIFAPTTYNYSNTRSYENNKDTFSISTDGLTLTIVSSSVKGPEVDHLRILITPEPSTGLLFGVGLVAGALSLRRRRRRRLKASGKATELRQ